MFVGNKNENEGVAKYKGLTTIMTNGKPLIGQSRINTAKEKCLTILKDGKNQV